MHHFPTYSKQDDDTVSSLEFWRRNAMEPSEDTGSGRKTYAPSKLAAILFSLELNRRFGKSKGIRSIAVNPGSVNSDIWRNYSSVMKSLFRRIYLTQEQGCSTSVAASVLEFEDETIYLQPYRQPLQKRDSPPYPMFEMLGPYQGYRVTQPRLPDDGGIEASNSLFTVCEELAGCKFEQFTSSS